jgi:recombination protein RecR
LADAIREVKEKVGLCEVCFNLAEGSRCRICEDERRDRSVICVVEEPADVIPIERTGEYHGVYHVLGGALSPIDGIDPEDLKIAELGERLNGTVKEIVLATNPTTTGEATALHIAEQLRDRVTVTRLASGLPVGADLEHADEVTLGKALAGRRSLS